MGVKVMYPKGGNKAAPGTRDWWSGFDSDLWNMGIDPEERPLERYDQLVAEMEAIESNRLPIRSLKSIDFDLRPGRATSLILQRLPRWISMIVDKIDPNDKWMVFYQYDNAWRSRKLDEITGDMLKKQVYSDLNPRQSCQLPGINMVRMEPMNYDFMPVSIDTCQVIRIVNLGNYNTKIEQSGRIEDAKADVHIPKLEDDEMYKAALSTGNADLIKLAKDAWGKKYKVKRATRFRKGGSFWRWTCRMPINLERYMIFNTLDKRTIKLMEEDNCLIYACKQFGLPRDIIDHMKDVIKVKHFSLSKLKEVALDTGITFLVEERDGRKHIQGDNKGIVVPLLLYENHYMLNERVKISPYYIRHIDEINADRNASKWELGKKQIIDRYRLKGNKRYYSYDQPDYPLKLVLRTIFECDGFEPIKMGEYLTYASSLYRYKLDPIDDLDYNPKFCCRLKAPLWKPATQRDLDIPVPPNPRNLGI